MSPIDWAVRPFQKYADFNGRAARPEFWWYVLLTVVAGVVAMILDSLIGTEKMVGPYGLVTLLLLAVTIVPSIAVQTRRLHDTNRSGLWLVGFYIPYAIYVYLAVKAVAALEGMQTTGEMPADAGSLAMTGLVGLVVLVLAIVLIVFFVKRGTVGENRYGPDPDAGGTSA